LGLGAADAGLVDLATGVLRLVGSTPEMGAEKG
jgi:hypothetical protein